MTEFRVIDLRTEIIQPEHSIEASSPEDAARKALGIDVFRSGHKQHLGEFGAGDLMEAEMLGRLLWSVKADQADLDDPANLKIAALPRE